MRRAHAGLAAVDLGHREDHVRRGLDGALHEAARRADVLLGERVGELVQVADAALDHAVDGLDGLLARDLARGVTAHAVGDDVEAEPVVEEERVLVRLALLARRRTHRDP